MYLLYGGSTPHWMETELSLVSLHYRRRASAAFRVVLATDEPERAGQWQLDVLSLPKARIREWKGPHRYNHRVKNRALSEVMKAFPKSRVCLIDGDTLFVDDPARLFERIGPGRALLHTDEGLLSERFGELEERASGVARGPEAFLRPDTRMLNSGVIGLDPSDRPLLDEALTWLDLLYEATRTFTVEQLALGETLRRSVRLAFAEDVVFHYWNHLRFFLRIRGSEFLAATASVPYERRVAQFVTFDASMPRLPLQARLAMAGYRRLRGWSNEFAFFILCAWAAAGGAPLADGWRAWMEAQLPTLLENDRTERRWFQDAVARRYLKAAGVPEEIPLA